LVRLSATAREERTGERRGQILRAALDVFSRKGFHGATIREIAAAAGVAEGTIYLYFENKQDVLTGVFALIAEESAAQPVLEATRGRSDADVLTVLIRDRIRTLAAHASFIRLIAHEADLHEDLRREFFARLHAPFVAAFRRYLEERIAQGVFRPVNTAIAASLCFRMIMSHVMVHRVLELDHDPGRYEDEAYIAEMVALVLYGFTARQGIAG
jgi:AcrR family transcriptional regulator